MTLLSRLALSLAAVTALPLGPALAADYDPPIIVDEQPEYVPVEVGSGWYLRGDIGYVVTDSMGGVDYRTFDGVTYSNASFATTDMSSDFSFGGGFGYRFNDWFRADATVEGLRARFSGTTVSATECPGGPVGTTCRSEDSARFSSIGAMANGYVDLGTYVGLTPYVGAGAGYTRVSWSNLTNQSYCVGGACPVPPALTPVSHGGEASWRFTYALMAGLAYDVSRNVKLDLGYKYRKVNGGDMFGWDATSAGAGATGVQGVDKGFSTHEVKVGLRYELW